MTEMAEKYPFGAVEGLVPHPRYTQLRTEQGMTRIQTPWGGPAWLATHYDDVRFVLADPRFSRALAAGREEVARARPIVDDTQTIMAMDPPDHTRLRRLVAKVFTVRQTERMRELIRGIVEDLLAAHPTVLVADFAWPLPMNVISELLGVPEEDRADFQSCTEETLALGVDLDRTRMERCRDRLWTYIGGLVAQRRQRPTDDLLSDLVAARDNDDRLSEDELVRLAVTLLIAGFETTANQITNSLAVLLADNRAGWRELVANPALVPSAVEELLRYVPLVASAEFARVAREDVEVGGTQVRAGEAVLVEMHAANRDSAVFADPDTLDLARPNNPHLAFGHGIHHCLGAPLARLELQLALAGLITHMPDLRLTVPFEDVRWRTDQLLRGAVALPVTW
jgi:cytochrome P450